MGELNMKLQGALTALVTPFTDDDRVDVAALKRFAQAQIDGGIDGLVVSGTTGESATLSSGDCKVALEAVLEVSNGKLPVILGTGSNCTTKTIEATKLAKEWGADAALVVCPYYNKPTQEGMYQHFKAVYEASGIPIVAYNVPGRTASDLTPETIARLVDAGAIVAVKDATANMQRAVETLAAVDSSKPFSLMSGDDFTILPFIACGGSGVISVVSHLAPGDCSELVRAAREGRWDVARPIQAKLIVLSKVLFSVSNPMPVKAGVSILGFGSPRTRLPLVTADDAVIAMVRDAMVAYGGIL
jgi:4-hydroxy-tetrahydrodipicolinate synthase